MQKKKFVPRLRLEITEKMTRGDIRKGAKGIRKITKIVHKKYRKGYSDKKTHKQISVRLPLDLVKRIDVYREENRLPSRSYAVEELLIRGFSDIIWDMIRKTKRNVSTSEKK